jgi:hypothetical protein
MASEDQGRIFSVRPARLAAPLLSGNEAPSLADVGLGWLEAEIIEWQLVRAQSWFYEIAAIQAAEKDRWSELGLLFGSSAEGVLMAATAEVEIVLLRQFVNESGSAGGPSGAWLGLRFFAESQGQMTLSAGHRLVNMVARALMADPSYPWPAASSAPLRKRILDRPFPPYSDERSHWLGMEDIDELVAIANRCPHQSLRTMAAIVGDLRATDQWKRLDEQRGKDFHRAREESPVVSRGERRTAWVGNALNVGPPRDADPKRAEEDVERIAAISRAALEDLGRRLAPFRDSFFQSMNDVSGGSVRLENDSYKG